MNIRSKKQPSTDVVSVLGVGDVCVNREKPESIFELVSPIMNQADMAVCQLEAAISERGYPQVHNKVPLRVHPSNIDGLKFAGFDVVSFASNHCMDYGIDAFFDTINLLRQNNIKVIGAGKDIVEARKPAIIERKGVRVAFLGYNSILHPGYAAITGKPGCSAIRVRTLYEPLEPNQPGTSCRIVTIPYAEDVDAMREDIRNAKALADVVILMMHWGLHHAPVLLAMYQREVGHAAIDAGADLIFGHHAHILKGIEVYKGKVIFYSLCNFAFDLPAAVRYTTNYKESVKDIREKAYHWEIDPNYPTYAFQPDARKTILAKCIISNKQIQRVTFMPVIINKKGQPEVVHRENKDSQEVLNFINEASKELGTKLSFEGDEVLIHV
ncbi:CapA family protein [Chloroflexota bacterium]